MVLRDASGRRIPTPTGDPTGEGYARQVEAARTGSPTPTVTTNRSPATPTTIYEYQGVKYNSDAELKAAIQKHMRGTIVPDIAEKQRAAGNFVIGQTSGWDKIRGIALPSTRTRDEVFRIQPAQSSEEIATNKAAETNGDLSWYQRMDDLFGGYLPGGISRAENALLDAQGLSDLSKARAIEGEAERAEQLRKYSQELQEQMDEANFKKVQQQIERQEDLAKKSWYEFGGLFQDPEEEAYQEALRRVTTTEQAQALVAEAKMKGIDLSAPSFAAGGLFEAEGKGWTEKLTSLMPIALLGAGLYVFSKFKK